MTNGSLMKVESIAECSICDHNASVDGNVVLIHGVVLPLDRMVP